jgi:hypothetical protein
MARHRPRAPMRVVSLGKVCEGLLHLRKKRSKSLVEWGKWLKETRLGVGLVSNSSFLNGDVGITGLVIPNFSQQIIVSPLVYFSLYLLVSVLPHYILWCALLLCRYCVYPSLNIPRSSLHIFCKLDCWLRENCLNSLIPVRPVWYTGQTGLD